MGLAEGAERGMGDLSMRTVSVLQDENILETLRNVNNGSTLLTQETTKMVILIYVYFITTEILQNTQIYVAFNLK